MENLDQAIWIMLKGLLVVFAVMGLIAGATWLAGLVFIRWDETDKERAKAEEEAKKRAMEEKKKAKAAKKKAKAEAKARAESERLAKGETTDTPAQERPATAEQPRDERSKTEATDAEPQRSDGGGGSE